MANSKNGKWKWILGIGIVIATAFGGMAGTWALYGKGIEDNKTAIEKHEGYTDTIFEKHDVRLTKGEGDMAEVKSDIKVIRVEQRYIREGIDEIKERLE